MSTMNHHVVLVLDDQRYALALSSVERVLRAVEITPLPRAPEIVKGIVNVQGQIIPVFDIRKRFRLPEREISPCDHLIIAKTTGRHVALLADVSGAVVEIPEEEITTAGKILPGLEYVRGVLKLEDGMVLIHDLDTFLSLEEENRLDDALKEIK